ncbi:type II toxin-antitoxin system PemK/MazF family toxin [Streptomyces sp. ZYX-F-203]
MDTSWWLAGAAVVVLAVVAALVDGWGRAPRPRRRRPGGPAGPPGRPTGPAPRRPRPAEIWWAAVPYEEGSGSKDRPCLVLSVGRERALVAKITSRRREGRPGVIPLPPGVVGEGGGLAGFLETDELREVPVPAFRRRVGEVDPVLWDRVRRLAR